MPINYNTWFYEYHKYLKGTKPGNDEYNDTKWVELGKRYQTLIDIGSRILINQPYGVIGNHYAFERLIELLGRSNYTFGDINEALLETYNVNLRNAMSRMLTNTHNVMYACKSSDKSKVYTDSYTHKFVIEVPFDQMHFGERDEFIRQKLQKMHQTSTDLYLPIDEFYQSDISNLLGFTIICTTNGYISNDCDVALSEKGLRFKIGWNHSEDCEFIIYKLDKAYITAFVNVNANDILSYDGIGDLHLTLRYAKYENSNKLSEYDGCKCLVNIYDPNYVTSTGSVVNFGIVRGDGVDIRGIQPKTNKLITQFGSKQLTVVIYVLKFFHEIKGVYPALNYMDMMENKLVYTDHDNDVSTETGKRVVMTSGANRNDLESCTPPICIDRPVINSYDSFAKCLNLQNVMTSLERIKEINTVVAWYNGGCERSRYSSVSLALKSYYRAIKPYYMAYIKCAIITSLIDQSYVDQFNEFINEINGLLRITDIDQADEYADSDAFSGYYEDLVDSLCQPFKDPKLQQFEILENIDENYYREDDDRFNRPVAEQSFISLKYDREEECWLFCNPDIRHFTGIGNTFYINSKLDGDEIFKFFVLYSDTESPAEETVDDDFPTDVVVDFDKFYDEVDKHIGFIRYWHAENKLAKLCYITENRYDEETTIHVLSKILKHKIDGRDLLYEYDSDMNYEKSAITSDNVGAGEYDERAPFAVNYLFYTLSLMQNNEDKLQAYFYHQLTRNKFNARYTDLNIHDALYAHGTIQINPSAVSIIPHEFDITGVDKSHMLTDFAYHMYCGLPYIFYRNTITDADYYPYALNTYSTTGCKCNLIEHDYVDNEHYIDLQIPHNTGYQQLDGSADAQLVRLITYYLSAVYDVLSYIETNYAGSFNKTLYIEKGILHIQSCIDNIQKYVNTSPRTFMHPNTQTIIDSIINNNAVITTLKDLQNKTNDALMISSRSAGNVYRTMGKYLKNMTSVFTQIGFKQHYLKNARRTYIHIKKLNKPMNLIKYHRYWDEIDYEFMRNISKTISSNPTSYSSDIFAWSDKIVRDNTTYIQPAITALNSVYHHDIDILRSDHMTPIQTYCADVVQNYIFDIYTIDKITFLESTTNAKPVHFDIILPNDEHTTYPGKSTEYTRITGVPMCAKTTHGYTVNGLIPSMYYAFFNGDDIDNLTCKLYDENHNVIKQLSVSITFMRIGSMADDVGFLGLLNPICNTRIDIQNGHENMDVTNNNMVVNEKHAPINYELLFSNQFYPLDHHSELIKTVKGVLSGSIDRIYIRNYHLNQIALSDFSHKTTASVYVKPVQIPHFKHIGRSYIDSIGGGNFVNQRVYLKTNDGTNYIFPAKVTCIDHNIGRGILELEVESRDAKWLHLTNPELIQSYLTGPVECTILPDNISNFLDEFSNDAYDLYNPCTFDIDEEYSDETFENCYSFPGDPIFVESNADYVYTRLNYHMDELVPNRFIDNEHKTYRFIYMGAQDSRFEMSMANSPILYLSLLKHHFNMLSNPEMYPILRDEPNDHSVWNAERKLFEQLVLDYWSKTSQYTEQIRLKNKEYAQTNDFNERIQISLTIQDLEQKREYAHGRAITINRWMKELEKPTTWFNVYSYDAADTYVHNGRAPSNPSFQPDIRDIPLFEELQLYIYDWEHHIWVNPELYEFNKTPLSNDTNVYLYDNPDDFLSRNVFDQSIITLKPGFPKSKRLLMYLAYDTSKFTLIGQPDLEQTCDVYFKPILSINHDQTPSDVFDHLKLRKVFNVDESYTFSNYNAPESFSKPNAFHVIRDKRSGRNMYSPTVRLCDVAIFNGNHEYDITNFNIYTRVPFPDVTIDRVYRIPTFVSLTNLPMDDFVPNQSIKLICIQNRIGRKYDGVMSSFIFEGITGNTIEDPLIITASSVPYLTNGSYICTVYMDSTYPCKGGIYTISVTHPGESLVDSKHEWIRISDTTSMYRELPDEFLLQPKTLTLSGDTTIQLKSTYNKAATYTIYPDNSGRTNLMEFMYDTHQHVRLPISDVIHNDYQHRLIVDTSVNPNVKTLHTTYVNVCRYSLNTIPEDGFIDVTGYVPTPLTRERYEWWVNGRYVNDDVVILSPTSFQLTNLKSLHNFELIELVDDVDDSQLMLKSNMYVGLDGKMYSSYENAFLSNQDIIQQDIRYTFNAYPNHTKLQDFSKGIINPNNKDVEINILNGYVSNSATSYEDLYHYPTINGVQLHHVTTEQIGLYEIPFDDIIKEYDRVWKKEILDNELFPMTHRDSTMMSDTYNRIHVHESDKYEGMFVVHVYGLEQKYHTLYISTLEDGGIDETDYTQKIIPFVKNGTRIHIDGKYRGMWIHTTAPNYKSIQIK